MRRGLLVGVTALVCAAAMPVGASVAATQHAPGKVQTFAQKQTGIASGTAGFLVSAAQPGFATESDSGTYALSGQLGRGRYLFKLAFDPKNTGCAHSTDIEKATGTAKLARSDGAVLTGTVEASEKCAGAPGIPVTMIIDLTQGSRELVSAHLELRGMVTSIRVSGPETDTGSEAFAIAGSSTVTTRIGYWMVAANGTVHAFGGVNAMGNAPTTSTAVHIEPAPTGNGYWIVDTLGRVFAFGDARRLGNANRALLVPGEVITSLSATPTGRGYWLFTDRGRELPFGDTKDFGDLHAVALNGAVIGSSATPTAKGYYMVALDGGVFAFGDARFRGSMGAAHLNQPVNGLVPTADNTGYWLVASDGGVFTFHAPFLGSMGGTPLTRAIIGMVRYGNGYLMVAQDGGIFNFSHQPFFGSLGGVSLTSPVVSAASVG
jgi:hypothetical protein